MHTSKLLAIAAFAAISISSLSACHSSRKGMRKLYTTVKSDQTNAQVKWKGDSIRIVYAEVAMFDFGKDEIKPDAYPYFKSYAGIMNQYTWVNFIINGYTDNVGPDDVNMSLSERRAANAKQLLQTDGIAPSRMATTGYGPAHPVMDNTTQEGRQANRRVEFVIYRKP